MLSASRLLPLALAISAVSARAAAAPQKGASLNQAAAFYHQGRFDSALTRLEGLRSQGPWKHRDSLSLFQYLGMASAKLGREDQAVGYFSGLLEVDSLFQFPRNEDPLILQAFSRAKETKIRVASRADSAAHTAAGTIDSAASLLPAPGRAKISMADSGAPGGQADPGTGTALGAKTDPAPKSRNIGLAMGAVPLGAGWLARHRTTNGLALGILQAGGIALSLYASQMQSREQGDAYKVRDKDELASVQTWQWVQRVSLSTALGAYLFSLIASAGD